MIRALKFEASWCAPCQALNPTWKKLSEELSDVAIFQTIDIDSNPQTRADFNVRSIPTIILVDGDKELDRKVGTISESQLRDWIIEQKENS